MAAFKWDRRRADAERAELEVGSELVVDLPLPGGPAPEPRPARPRPPSELERVREQLLSATKERRELEAALGAATVQADQLARVRAERDRAREEAEQARADGERLVNDEYRQRERAEEIAEQTTARARDAEAAQRLAERQLGAAREAHTVLEARLAELEERLRAELDDANEERERLRAELEAAASSERRARRARRRQRGA